MAWHEAFRREMETVLGAEAPAFFAALEEAPRKGLRLLPGRGDGAAQREALRPFLASPIPFAGDGWFLKPSVSSLGNHPLHAGGAIYLQDPAAMAPASCVTVREDDRILDLCAAPGGKSVALGARLGEDGVLVCNEPSPVRRRILLQNLERCGVPAAVYGLDAAEELPAAWREAFDLVVCDAPCSGEGMFRKEPEAVERWSEERVESLAALQERILARAADCVAPGGTLLYATCTWNRKENEEQIARLLARRGDLTLSPAPEAVRACSRPGVALPGFDGSGCRRFYPHVFPGEGQFLAILVREGTRPPRRPFAEEGGGKKRPEEAVARDFLATFLARPLSGELLERDGLWYASLTGAGGASPGVLLGEVRKGRFVPHHRLFLLRHAVFRNTLELDEAEARAYLSGEELPRAGDGWAQARYLGCPLGGVKLSGGRAKNHYPKGLRIHV